MLRIKKDKFKTLVEEPNVIEEPVLVKDILVKSKRGRKSKKYIQQQLELQKETNNNLFFNSHEVISNNDNLSNVVICTSPNELNVDQIKLPAKKRGRKPKGGKIVQQPLLISNVKESKPNIILHLKCCLKDLEHNLISNNIDSYNFNCKSDLTYDIISINNNSKSLENDIVNNNLPNNYNDFNDAIYHRLLLIEIGEILI